MEGVIMQCPRCFQSNVTAIADSHYVCNNPDCSDDNGNKVQFSVVEDKNINFPYNQIFVNRGKKEFYRKPYLELEEVGMVNTTK